MRLSTLAWIDIHLQTPKRLHGHSLLLEHHVYTCLVIIATQYWPMDLTAVHTQPLMITKTKKIIKYSSIRTCRCVNHCSVPAGSASHQYSMSSVCMTLCLGPCVYTSVLQTICPKRHACDISCMAQTAASEITAKQAGHVVPVTTISNCNVCCFQVHRLYQ